MRLPSLLSCPSFMYDNKTFNLVFTQSGQNALLDYMLMLNLIYIFIVLFV